MAACGDCGEQTVTCDENIADDFHHGQVKYRVVYGSIFFYDPWHLHGLVDDGYGYGYGYGYGSGV